MDTLTITATSDDIHCSMCKKRYTDPRILPCLHSFCQNCLLGVALKKGQGLTIQCAKCKKDHHVTDTRCAQLPTNVHILGLIQLHKVKSEKDRKCLVCQLSKRNSNATNLCLSCDDLLCDTCSKGHNSASVTASHKVVTLDDILKGTYDREIYNRVAIRCDKHEAKEYMLYCNDCQSIMCLQCALENHRHHSHSPTANVVIAKQKSLCECLKQVSSSRDQVLKSIEERIANVDRNQKEFEHSLHMGVASVIDQLHREKKEILEKARTIFQENKMREYELKTSVKTRSTFEDMYRLVVSKGGPGLAMMSGTLEKGVESLKQSVSVELPSSKEILPEIKGMNEQTNLITIVENHRESRNLTTTCLVSGEHSDQKKVLKEPSTSDGDEMKDNASAKMMVTSEVREKESPSTFTNPSAAPRNVAAFLDYETDFVAKVSKDSLPPAINSLSLYGGKLMLLDINNMKIKIYTVEGRLFNLHVLPCRSTVIPERAVLSECLVGISDCKLVIYSSPSSGLKALREIKLSVISQVLRPVISRYKDNQVLVANLPNDEIKIFDNKGNLKKTRKTHVMGPIVSVHWSKTGKIIMCSWKDAGSVQIESDEGEFLLEIHKHIDGKRLSDWRPVDACMSSLGFIVVSDSKRNELSVFDPQGLELMVLNTSEDEFTYPGRLQIDDDDNLFVSGKDGLIVHYRLSCYSVKYTKLKK